MSLHHEVARKLLMTIDAIECDMRHLEVQLTHVRKTLHEAYFSSPICQVELNGRTKRENAEGQAYAQRAVESL